MNWIIDRKLLFVAPTILDAPRVRENWFRVYHAGHAGSRVGRESVDLDFRCVCRFWADWTAARPRRRAESVVPEHISSRTPRDLAPFGKARVEFLERPFRPVEGFPARMSRPSWTHARSRTPQPPRFTKSRSGSLIGEPELTVLAPQNRREIAAQDRFLKAAPRFLRDPSLRAWCWVYPI